METVNNIAKAAANAVWGENTTTGNTTTATTGTEPVSGQRGNTSAGEPYDKGNLEEPNSTTSTTGHSTTGDSTSGVGGTSVGGFSSGLPDRSATHGAPDTSEGGHASGNTSSSGVTGSGATTVSGEPHPLSGHHSSTSGTTGGYTSGTTEGSHGPHDSKVANAADPRVDSDRDGSRTVGNTGNTGSHTGHHDTAQFAKSTGTAAESDNVPDNKYTERKAQDTPADTSKGQNDTRDPSDPQTNPKNNPTDVDDTTSGPNKGQELGPGPKPLTDVAREHGGDAGNTGKTESTGDDKSKGESAETEDPNDPRAPSHGEGTGEKYIKSSGLAADGGDFDASNAGAGKEADRLLEEKGIHRDPGAPAQSTGGDETTEKKSLKDKIKEKLHRN